MLSASWSWLYPSPDVRENGAQVGRKNCRGELTVVDLPESTCLWSDRLANRWIDARSMAKHVPLSRS